MKFILLLVLCIASARGEVIFPGDSGFVNVREKFGAKGDGVTDDTAAFRQAAKEGVRNLFIPSGTYLIGDTLAFLPKRWVLQGQDREKTILRLKDAAPGFGDAAKPKPFVSFFEPFMEKKASTGQAFRNSLYNLTIEIGAGNPGAVALNYLNNNQGTVEGVTIRSRDPQRRGKAGLALVCNWPGPALIKNVRIEGFDFGVWSTIGQYSMAFEHLELEGQREAGIWNGSQPLSIRGLRSKNSVPALKNTDWSSLVVLVDAELTGGAPGATAIENFDPAKDAGSGPGLFVRNLKTQGYKLAIVSRSSEKPAAEVPGGAVAEFTSHEARALGAAKKQSLNLPIEETPTVPEDPPAQWVSVAKFAPREFETIEKGRPVKKKDWSGAIQQAIDSGATTVYFPKLEKEQYEIADTVHIRGKVRRIIGMENGIVAGAAFAGTEKAAFRFEDGASPVVVFERFNNTYGNQVKYSFEQATTRAVVLKNLLMSGYRNTVPGGKLFIEDLCADRFDFDRQKVWARQLNPEAKGDENSFNIRNRGGDLWILNLKTEGPKTAIETTGGGRTEVLGGYLYPSRGTDKGAAAFEVKDSKLSASYTNQHGIFAPQVRVTARGRTSEAMQKDVPPRKYATKVPLIVAE